MKIDIMNIDKFVETNNLKEVTNPIHFNKGYYPTDDGLFSYEIFGRPGSYDRKTVFAYIDLHDKFLHPLVYKNLLRLNRRIEELVSGITYFKIDTDGALVKVDTEEEGGTGLSFLYKNWEKIKFVKSASNKRDERLDFFTKVSKNDAFMSKFLVMPCFYRDIDTSKATTGKIRHDEINDIYAKIIRLCKALTENEDNNLEFVYNTTKANIEDYLVQAFDYCIGLTKRKSGLLHQAVLGKSIDYSARNVISEADYHSTNTYSQMRCDMTHVGVPLATLLNTFTPFILKWINDFFQRQIGIITSIPNSKGERIPISKTALDDFSFEVITEKIHLFTKSPTERFEVIKMKMEDGKYYTLYYTGRNRDDADPETKDSTIGQRPLTWTDIFYQACVDVCKDKHVYITRYPLEDYFGIYPSRINVMSTHKTTPQYIEGTYYEYYPVIDLEADKRKIAGLFVDSLQLFNPYLAGLGGDFDGKLKIKYSIY